MSTNKHTPGPWTVGNVIPGEPGMYEGTRTVEAPYDAESQTVALVHPSTDGAGSCWMEREERDANAALIAAAPDLLACLTEMLATDPGDDDTDICPLCGNYPHQDGKGGVLPVKHSDHCMRVRAAIAKAEGTTVSSRSP